MLLYKAAPWAKQRVPDESATCSTCPFAVKMNPELVTSDYFCRGTTPFPMVIEGKLQGVHTSVGGKHWCGVHPGRRV